MKRIIILALMLLPLAVSAGPVSRDVAQKCAESFFRGSMHTKASASVRLVWDGEFPTKAPATDPAFYVYASSDGGFVMISGDDAFAPVLAWSDNTDFVTEDMPDNVRGWMEELRAGILSDRAAGVQADPDVRKAWSALESSGEVEKAEESLLLETALWNQNAPYNGKCPDINGVRTYTGCVATAMAIIMKYHRWPVCGSGTFETYSYVTNGTTITMPGYSLGHVYDWSNLPDDMSNRTTEQAIAVAQLMLDCGMSLKMKYEASGSSASTANLGARLVTYFGYDSSARYISRSSMSADLWVTLLKDNLNNFGPVSYRGAASSGSGGHSFIVSGYDSSDRMYVNFGWGGSSNGYYTIPDFKTYDTDHAGVFYICPAGGGTKSSSVFMYSGGLKRVTTMDQIAITGKVNLSVGSIYNMGSAAFSGQFVIFRLDRNGQRGEQICEPFEIPVASGGYSSAKTVACTLASEVNLGDQAALYYRMAEGEEWKLLPCATSSVSTTVPIADTQDIGQSTKLVYTVESGVLDLTTKGYVSYTLLTEGGEVVASGKASSSGKISLETMSYKPGAYVLSLSRGSDSQVLKINIKGGN